MSSGKFAVNLVVLEVYSRAIAAVRGLNEMQTKQLSGALSHAFASNGGFISADAIRNITSTEVGQSRDGSGGSGGRLSGGEWWQPSGSSSSASSSGAGASRGEDPYFGSSPTFSPGGQSGGGGGFGAGGGGSGVGSATNPLVVSVAPGRRSMFLTVVRIVGVGVSLAILYQLLFSKSGGLAGKSSALAHCPFTVAQCCYCCKLLLKLTLLLLDIFYALCTHIPSYVRACRPSCATHGRHYRRSY